MLRYKIIIYTLEYKFDVIYYLLLKNMQNGQTEMAIYCRSKSYELH